MRKFLLQLFGLLPKRPKGHPPFAFLDQNGLEYYSWSDLSVMPPARVSEVEDILLQIDAGMSRKTLATVAEAIVVHVQDAMSANDKKQKALSLARVSFLATELLARPRSIIPQDCYYELAAICAVRKDEDPYTFDRQIQLEKVETFGLAGRAGLSFFTGTGLFKTILGASRSTVAGLRELQKSWTLQESLLRGVSSITSSESVAGTAEKNSEA